MNPVMEIVTYMGANNGKAADIQKIQTGHRLKLVEFWGIKEGNHVLEIGCGQGDTTAVLAYTVGEKGMVHGIDIATPDYGAPVTLGEAAEYLRKSPLGKQLKIDFNVDILSPKVDFPADSFDYIIFSHCSWYLKSFAELEAIFQKTRKWGKKLCFAEWDARVQSIEQYPHFLAVLIQSHYECFKENSSANVRTLFTPADVRRIAEKANWSISQETSIYSPDLQDGEWEVAMALTEYQQISLSEKLTQLINSEITLLEEARTNHSIKPLSTFVFIAERDAE
jgi:SAM-dependent methyltransferase